MNTPTELGMSLAANPYDSTGKVPCWLGQTTIVSLPTQGPVQTLHNYQLNRLTLPVANLWRADGYEWLRDVQTGWTWAWDLNQMQ